MFVDRKNELQILERLYDTGNPEFFVIYGRRRVGKTELIKEFLKGKKSIYFMADLNTERQLMERLSERAVSALSSEIDHAGLSFISWDGIFKFIAGYGKKERVVLVLDEFQYICSANRAFPSILQRLWDESLKDTKLFIILCGSYISFMENDVLAARSPLYGRRTAQYMLQPINFFHVNEFYPKYDIEKLIVAYSILGGIPAYLNKFDDRKGIAENINTNILPIETFLHNEVQFLLIQELKETRNYFAILQQIADGETKLNDIVMKSGLDRGLVSKYLYTLQELRIVEREIPSTEKNPLKSKRGLYRIKDHYMKFWFRFIFPNKSFIEEYGGRYVLDTKIIPRLNEYVSGAFEEICIEFLKRINISGGLPFVFERIGRWWDGAVEIDILASGENGVLLGECKWNEKRRVGVGLYNDLKAKAAGVRCVDGMTRYYALFSRSGFSDDLVNMAQNDKTLFLYDLDDIGRLFETKM